MPAAATCWPRRWRRAGTCAGSSATATPTASASYDNLVNAYPQGKHRRTRGRSRRRRVASPGCPACSSRVSGTRRSVNRRSFTPVPSSCARCRQPSIWRATGPAPMHRDTIFPEDSTACAAPVRRAVTHEAPSRIATGFTPIDDLAAQCGARWIVHGHHHQSYTAALPTGIRVRGLGLGECWNAVFAAWRKSLPLLPVRLRAWPVATSADTPPPHRDRPC